MTIEPGQTHHDGIFLWTVTKVVTYEHGGWKVTLERNGATLTLYGTGDIEKSHVWQGYFGEKKK